MTMFDARERAFEAKFARDEAMAFMVGARQTFLFAQDVAQQMGLTIEEQNAYARYIVYASIKQAPGFDAVERVQIDLGAAGINITENDLTAKWDKCHAEAMRQYGAGPAVETPLPPRRAPQVKPAQSILAAA